MHSRLVPAGVALFVADEDAWEFALGDVCSVIVLSGISGLHEYWVTCKGPAALGSMGMQGRQRERIARRAGSGVD